MKRILIGLISLAALIAINAGCSNSKISAKNVVFKGFRLGMPLNEAIANAALQFEKVGVPMTPVARYYDSNVVDLQMMRPEDPTIPAGQAIQLWIGRKIAKDENLENIGDPVVYIRIRARAARILFALGETDVKPKKFVKQFQKSFGIKLKEIEDADYIQPYWKNEFVEKDGRSYLIIGKDGDVEITLGSVKIRKD